LKYDKFRDPHRPPRVALGFENLFPITVAGKAQRSGPGMNNQKTQIPQPTRTELSILSILWDKGPCTVRDVHEALNKIDPSGYTTALKMLQVMHQKGQVERDDSARAHVYSAAVSQDQTQKLFLADIAERLFGGSTSRLVLQALGNAPNANQEDLESIRELLSRVDGE